MNNDARISLYRALCLLETPEEACKLFEDIMSQSEISKLSKRWSVFLLLLSDNRLSQREVAERLGVSITTVTRAVRVLKSGKGACRLVLDRLQHSGNR